MADRSEDLRSTADSIRQDAQTVKVLEDEKAGMDPADPRVDELSRRIEALIDKMGDKAAAERELADEIGDSRGSGGTAR